MHRVYGTKGQCICQKTGLVGFTASAWRKFKQVRFSPVLLWLYADGRRAPSAKSRAKQQSCGRRTREALVSRAALTVRVTGQFAPALRLVCALRGGWSNGDAGCRRATGGGSHRIAIACGPTLVIDYTGSRDFSRRILSYVVQIRIVEVIG